MPHTLEQSIEYALSPGQFIGDADGWDFVNELDEVEDRIQKLIETDPKQAVALYETFIAACYEKAEEVDDSSGSFGMFAGGLFCHWIEARQAAGADPDETAKILLDRMDHDDYGFCYRLEQDAAKAFDARGLAAFERLVRDRFEAEVEAPSQGLRSAGYRRRWAGGVLKAIYNQRRDTAAYAAVAEAMGLTPADCEAIAQIHQGRGELEEALNWVERGLELERSGGRFGMGSAYQLPSLQRELLKRLGRNEQALSSAWEAFEKYPSAMGYQELMRYVPESDKKQWREKALAAAGEGNLTGFIEICAESGEWARLAERLRHIDRKTLAGLSHYTLQGPAKMLAGDHPDVAALLYSAMGMRILNAGKSKYYGSALENFKQAEACYAKAGLEPAWQSLVAEIRANHGRKYGFMPGFEDLVAGRERPPKPGFLERARKHWPDCS